ncbi:hypothetical protein EIP86_000193, partial [Pleurotus ostreatoroseus]
ARPGGSIKTGRKKTVRKGVPDLEAQKKLRQWREDVFIAAIEGEVDVSLTPEVDLVKFKALPSKKKRKKGQNQDEGSEQEGEGYKVTWHKVVCAPVDPSVGALEEQHEDIQFIYAEGTVNNDGKALMTEIDPREPCNTAATAVNTPAEPSSVVPGAEGRRTSVGRLVGFTEWAAQRSRRTQSKRDSY